VHPDSIDLAFVPRHRPGVATVEAGNESMVIDDQADRPHLLNPTAALLWGFMDGVGSLADFSADLTDVLGADPRRIRADVVALVRDLGRRGLLDGVEPDPVGNPWAHVAPRVPPGARAAPPHARLDARFVRPEARVTTVRAGSVELDLRADDAELVDEVVAGLAGRGIVAESPRPVGDRSPLDASDAAPLYSLLVGRTSGPVTGLHLLYRSGRLLRRHRHRADVVRITVADVTAVVKRHAFDRPLLDVVGLARGDRLVAVDPLFSSMVTDLERSLHREGIERADASLLELAPPDAGRRLTALVLRPAARAAAATSGPPTPAGLAFQAIDLARGIDRRLSAPAVAQLCAVTASTPIERIPGRDGLRAAVLGRLT
jgi:hypothetical protein